MEKAIYNSEVFGINEKTVSAVSKICAAFLVFCPILQHYKAPVFNAGVFVLIIVSFWLMALTAGNIKNIKVKDIMPMVPMMIYLVFRVVNHGTSVTEFGQSGVIGIFMLSMILGCIDLKNYVRFASYIAIFASACLVMQYICFYIFGFHLQMVPTELLIDSADQWILGAKTGLYGITGVLRDTYRPSAFFLEPSHAYLYMFPHLVFFLFSEKDKKHSLYPAIFISLGLVLSTSGMGIVAAAAIWILYFILRDKESGSFSVKNIFRPEVLKIFAAFIALFIVLMIVVPFFREAVTRIFIPKEVGGSSAIEGRIKKALQLLDGMTLKDYINGVRDNTSGITFNIPGFADVLYRHGIIGMVLSYSVYVFAVFKSSLPCSIVSLGVLATSLASVHTHATVGIINFSMLIMSGYVRKEKKVRDID